MSIRSRLLGALIALSLCAPALADGIINPGSGSAGSGTVTSVGLSLPASLFTVSGSPVTDSGTLTGTLATQTANTVFAGPASGVAAAPTFRALVAADLPIAITSATATQCAIYSAATTINGYAGCTYVDPGQFGIIGSSAQYAIGAVSLDTFLTRPAAANWQFGAANAAAPVAQVTSVQSVVGGTSNTSAVNWTNVASLSTGSGTPGDYIIKTGFQGVSATGTATFSNGSAVISFANSFVAGQAVQFTSSGTLPTNFALATTYYVISTGLSGSQFEVSATQGGSAIVAGSAGSGTQTVVTATVQQGAVTAATFKGGTQQLQLPNGSAAVPAISGSTPATGIFFNSSSIGFNVSGAGVQGSFNSTGATINTGVLGLASTVALQWNNDTYFARDAAGIVGLANGAIDTGTVTSPSSIRPYNVASSSLTNYERMEVGFAAHTNVAAIDVAAAGTGTVRGFGVYTGGTIRLDYGVTTGSTLTASTNVATTGTLTVGTLASATGLFVCETAGLLSSGVTTCVASDRAVKHDIVAISDTNLLDKVVSKRGVRFTYNESRGAPGRRIGVIANDWEEDFPELVDYDTSGIRHFDYAATWGLTVELIRGLHADNDNLKAEVESLKRRVN